MNPYINQNPHHAIACFVVNGKRANVTLYSSNYVMQMEGAVEIMASSRILSERLYCTRFD